jgi:Skp family chaperone for outer membrane proteins
MNKVFFLAIAIMFSSCGDKDGKEEIRSKQVNVISKDSSGLVLAFYNYDSLKLRFEYYKNVEDQLASSQTSLQNKYQAKTVKYQNYVTKKRKEIEDGLLSQNETIQVQQKAAQMEQEIIEFQQRETAQLEAEMIQNFSEINNKVESFGKIFSKLYGIDVLFQYSKGQQINYINPTMNVTTDFINFLNLEQQKLEKDL